MQVTAPAISSRTRARPIDAIRSTGVTRSAGPLALYLRSLDATPLLTRPQEVALARRIARGAKQIIRGREPSADYLAAHDHLILANLRLVVSIARRYQDCGLAMEDLVSDGNCGLCRAVSHYDLARGARFTTYATWWIKQAIRQAIRDHAHTIRIKFRDRWMMRRWVSARQTLIARNGLVPSDAQVANSLGMTEKKANTVIAAIKAIALSRYDEHDPVYGMALEQFLVADADDMTSDANTNVDDKMQSIFDRVESLVASGAVDRRASEVIRLHFGIGEQRPMSLKAIGKRFGVTCEWVRRIEKTALAGLRAELAGVTT